MAKDLKDLQKLIEEKAVAKLDEDISKLAAAIRSASLLQDLPESLRISTHNDAGTDIQAPYYFFHPNANYMKKLKEYWLPIYIERESVDFFKKVNELTSQVDELFQTKADRGEVGY